MLLVKIFITIKQLSKVTLLALRAMLHYYLIHMFPVLLVFTFIGFVCVVVLRAKADQRVAKDGVGTFIDVFEHLIPGICQLLL